MTMTMIMIKRNISIFRSDDIRELDRMVAEHYEGMPFLNKNGDRIGTVTRMWRDGMLLMGEIEIGDEYERELLDFSRGKEE